MINHLEYLGIDTTLLKRKDLSNISMSDLIQLNFSDKISKNNFFDKKYQLDDPNNIIIDMNLEVRSISSPRNTAKLRHSNLQNLNRKKTSSTKRDAVKTDRKSTQKDFKISGEDVVKKKSVSSPRKLNPMNIVNKFKGARPLTQFAIGFGTAIGMTLLINSFRSWGRITPTSTIRVGSDDRGSAYIPERYSRGYDTIKEATTDFGSKVKLNKVAGKVNVTPRNSTRHNRITNTSSIIRSNLSLASYNNAIQHTRY